MTPPRSTTLSIQKFTATDRTHAIYELIDQSDSQPVLDITKGDTGEIRVCFHESSVSREVNLKTFLDLIHEAVRRLETDSEFS